MPASKDDRARPKDDSATRLRPAEPVPKIHDEESVGETEIYVGAKKGGGGDVADEDSQDETEVYIGKPRKGPAAKPTAAAAAAPAPAAAPAQAAPAQAQKGQRFTDPNPTVQERSRPGRAAPAAAEAPAAQPMPTGRVSLHQTVSLVRAPLDEQGFGARYLPMGVLGEGGMGTIGLCKDVRIGREVAMKLLRKEKTQHPDARMRFEREARVQGQLEHPAIVPVYDLGVRPDGTPFFTMKRLHGETLSEIMDALQKKLPVAQSAYPQRRLLDAFSRVCLAVAFANTRGVLHRDLKPSNIMLGDFGEVYLLDWGLAKLMGTDDPEAAVISANAQRQTQVGEVMGTPGYMSPEQLRGEIDQLDARTDVYTLGVLLFELLTLEPLHDRSGGLDTIYNSTLGKRDARLSERAYAKRAPPELVAVCVKATSLDRENRYASGREVAEAVERFLDGHRDVKQREEMAAEHAKTAMEAVALLGSNPEMRELAIRELGATLALDPTHAVAVETLTRLMLETPAELTAEARREFDRSRRGAYLESKRGVLASYVLWVCFIPLVVALGLRDRVSAVVNGVLVVTAALLSWLSATGRMGGSTRFVVYCLGTLAIASTCTLMGWAVVLPGLAAVHTFSFILAGDKRLQPAALALGALAVIVPFVLQESGWLQRAYLFEGDRMIVLPRMTGLPPVRTQIYLLLSSLALIVMPTVAISRLRDTLENAEERAFMHAWTLQHLLPGRAREAAAALRKGTSDKRG